MVIEPLFRKMGLAGGLHCRGVTASSQPESSHAWTKAAQRRTVTLLMAMTVLVEHLPSHHRASRRIDLSAECLHPAPTVILS